MAEIAINHGFKYGSQLPETVYFPIYFADQDWKKPDREKYIELLEEYRPHIATVLDLEREEQLAEVLDWAQEATKFVQVVVVIPKAPGMIEQLPQKINGKEVRLGYSVPTRYGGTTIHLSKFLGWPIHLLGGSPQKQMELCGHYIDIHETQLTMKINVPRIDVRSVDGNMMHKLAIRHCQFWCPGNATYAQNRFWPTLKEFNRGHRVTKDAPYIAFQKSCENIMEAWNDFRDS